MARPTTTIENHDGEERHPAFGLIGASRVQNSPPGASLFDSDVLHQHTVRVTLHTAERRRDLNHDHIYPERRCFEVELSEAQWASFVSSMNVGNGVPCTLRFREGEGVVPGLPFEPRMQESMRETREAAHRATEKVRAMFEQYREHKTAANLRSLQAAIENMPANVEFAAKSLSEHAENVVQKARVDIEAMVMAKAQQLGLEPGELGLELPALSAGHKRREDT